MTAKKTAKSQAPKTARVKKPRQSDAATPDPVQPAPETAPAPKPARPKGTRKAKAEPRARKTSALDAAVKVLGETGQAMSCKELIEAMATKGYWTSPAGKTPHATLYAAILREITTKSKEARFHKADRGKFALAKGQ